MMPSSSSSSSSSSATVRVDKATSDLLIGPDWTMNMDICDSINSNHWDAKDVVKAVKKRLQHKNPKVQLLALTLLETMVKNCGDYVHFQIADRNILQEMIKIVKKKTDMHVRDKVLVLLDSWQEAFGGPGGKYPQYYWAYEELRRFGVVFPQRSSDATPIFTPPIAQSTLIHAQAGHGMPSNSSTRLDEAMAAEMENLSLSSINSMRNVLDLLADMLQAVNPNDRASIKDEVIVDLANRCRSNQKKLMQMLTTSGDEELLGQGLELNDSLQSVLAKHDAIASGSPLPTQNFNRQSVVMHDSNVKPTELKEPNQTPNANLSAPVVASTRGHIEDEEDEEDDFAQLARRHSKMRPTTSQDTSIGASEIVTSVNASNNAKSSIPSTASPVPSNALVLRDPPAPVRTTKEQDMIDLLSLTLSTTTASPQTPHTPAAASSQNIHQAPVSPTTQGASSQNIHQAPVSPTTQGASSQNIHQAPVSPTTQGYPYASQAYPGNQGQVPFNSYVVPWAQPQPQPKPQLQPEPHPQPQLQSQPGLQPQTQPQPQPQYPQYSSIYPPPPWAPTPGYLSNQNHLSTTPYMFSTPRANTPASYTSMQGARPLQQVNSFPARGSNGSPMNGEPRVSSSPRTTAPAAGQKPFVPSYRLFEDLNVLGNGDGRYKMTSSTSPSLSGTSSQSMVGGRK